MSRIFRKPKPILAMVHTGPSPGAPGYRSVECAVERAVTEAKLYAELGVDGLLIENMHDFPTVHEREQGPEVTAFMTRVAVCVKRQVGLLPVGLQVLFQAIKSALAVALAAQCDFIRAEGWIYAHVSDKGYAEACAGEVLRYRRAIGAHKIPIFCDVKKKHASHALTADVSIAEMAEMMELHRADGVVVTGARTGQEPDAGDLLAVRENTDLPVLVGSGVTPDNFERFVELADGFIIGSAFKEGGVWNAPVCEDRVVALVEAAEHARSVYSAIG
ncbi:MAG: BtpA/SgcQ family protein [Rhodothermales bacterium]|nr:BtpA/SgcQ family protein [Rhodothermales bacterium]